LKKISKYSICLISIFFVFTGCGRTVESASPDIHGLISMVEHGENRAYIFGSMHYGRPEWYPLNEVVEDAMDRSDMFLFEFDLAQWFRPGRVCICENTVCWVGPRCITMEEAHRLSDGLTLEDVLPPVVFIRFMEILDTYENIAYEDIAGLNPVGIDEFFINYAVYASGLSYVHYGVDMYIARYAITNARPTAGLESIAQGLLWITTMPWEYQIGLLYYMPDRDAYIQSVIETANIYETQNIPALYDMLYPIRNAHEEYKRGNLSTVQYGINRFTHEIITVYRSIVFAEEIARRLQETEEPTTFFVTIGLGHMIGYDYGNVFNVLRDMGFDVVSLYRC